MAFTLDTEGPSAAGTTTRAPMASPPPTCCAGCAPSLHDGKLVLNWDGAATAPRKGGAGLGGGGRPRASNWRCSPDAGRDLKPVEALWRWLREDVTYHHYLRTAEDLTRRAEVFEARINLDPRSTRAPPQGHEHHLDQSEEKLSGSQNRGFNFQF